MRISIVRPLCFFLIVCILSGPARGVVAPTALPEISHTGTAAGIFRPQALAAVPLWMLHSSGIYEAFLQRTLAGALLTGSHILQSIPHGDPWIFAIFGVGAAVMTVFSSPPTDRRSVLETILEERAAVMQFHAENRRAVVVFGSARIPESDPVYSLGKNLGRALFKAGYAVRGGAGPSTMQAVPEGFIDARAKAGVETQIENRTQGIKIYLDFEAIVNPFIESYREFMQFVTRKLGLHNNTHGAIALPGGYGTLDEMFEVWQRGRPLVLLQPTEGPYRNFWPPIIEAFEKARTLAHMSDKLPPRPLITESVDEAITYLKTAPQKRWEKRPISVEKANDELRRGFMKLGKADHAVVMFGRPQKGSPAWSAARHIVAWLLVQQKSIRIGTRGNLVDLVTVKQKKPGIGHQRQAVLFIPPGQPVRSKEQRRFDLIVKTHDPSIHLFLVSKRAQAYFFLPGGVGTMNRLFDIIQLIQTHKLEKRPIFLVGRSFWVPFMEVIFKLMLRPLPIMDPASGLQKMDTDTSQPAFYSLISPGDEKIFHFVDRLEEVIPLFDRTSSAAIAELAADKLKQMNGGSTVKSHFALGLVVLLMEWPAFHPIFSALEWAAPSALTGMALVLVGLGHSFWKTLQGRQQRRVMAQVLKAA